MTYVHIYLWGVVVLDLLVIGMGLGKQNGASVAGGLVSLGLALPAAIIAGGVN